MGWLHRTSAPELREGSRGESGAEQSHRLPAGGKRPAEGETMARRPRGRRKALEARGWPKAEGRRWKEAGARPRWQKTADRDTRPSVRPPPTSAPALPAPSPAHPQPWAPHFRLVGTALPATSAALPVPGKAPDASQRTPPSNSCGRRPPPPPLFSAHKRRPGGVALPR